MPRRPARSATPTIFSIQTLASPPGCASVPSLCKFCKLQERHQQTQQTPVTFSAWRVSGATSLLLTSGMPAHVCAPFSAWVCYAFAMRLCQSSVGSVKYMIFASCLEPALPTVLDHLTWWKPVITLCTWAHPNVIKGLDVWLCYLVFGLILSSSPKIGGLHTRYSAEKIENGNCRVGWEATSSVSKENCHQHFCRKAAAENYSSSCNCTYREVL